MTHLVLSAGVTAGLRVDPHQLVTHTKHRLYSTCPSFLPHGYCSSIVVYILLNIVLQLAVEEIVTVTIIIITKNQEP